MTSLAMSPNAHILVVDDDPEELSECAHALASVTAIPPVAERKSHRAAELLRSDSYDLLVTDLRMPAPDGIDLLRIVQASDPELPVLILTGYPSVDTAVKALKLGASDYLSKPVNLEELVLCAARLLGERRLRGEHRLLERRAGRPYGFEEMVGESSAMRDVFSAVERLANSDVDVLIVGETGTGKELVARSLHRHSKRQSGRFVPVDCGAIPESLLEREFFGHERGAFSGAHARGIGLMEFADAGTLFLDEIVDLQLPLQAKLLRAIQERRIRRVGATREIPLDLRIVAAASRDPAELVAAGRFREELYYRLNVGRIELPPLRERGDDVPLLARRFAERFARDLNAPEGKISANAMEMLCAYPWPGNVRELQNVIKRALIMSGCATIRTRDLPDEVVAAAGSHGAGPRTFFELRAERVARFEREYLSSLLAAAGGDVTAAARKAAIPRGTLYRLLNKHGLPASDFRSRC